MFEMYWESKKGPLRFHIDFEGKRKCGWRVRNMSHVKNKKIQLSRLLNGWFAVSLCTECWTQSNEGFCKLVLTESTNTSSLIKVGQYPLVLLNFKKTKHCTLSFSSWKPLGIYFNHGHHSLLNLTRGDGVNSCCCTPQHVCSETWKSNVAYNGLISQRAQTGWTSR